MSLISQELCRLRLWIVLCRGPQTLRLQVEPGVLQGTALREMKRFR